MVAENNTEKKDSKKESQEFVNNLTEEIEYMARFVSVQDLREYPMYIYKNGVYEKDGDAWIRQFLAEKYKKINTGIIEEVVKRIRLRNLKPLSVIDSKKEKVVLLNGVFDLNTMKFEEHSPENYATIQLPVNYDKDAKCPRIHKYFDEVLHAHFIPTAYEIFGYCLWKGNDLKKIFFLVGGNNSSKGTFMGILRKFIGMQYITAMEMSNIAKDRFSRAELLGKSVNICGDTKSTMVKETGMLRKLSGNEDPIDGEKKFGGLFTFMNYCKLLFGFNILPKIPEIEMEFFADRMLIIQFPNTFSKKVGFLDNLTTPEEMSGLFNMAIEGLQRAFKNGQFTNNLTIEETIAQYSALADPITSFAYDGFEVNIMSFVEKEDLFEIGFQNYLKSKNISYSGSKDKFWKDLKDILTVRNPEVDWNRRVTIGGKQKYCIFGVSLNSVTELVKVVKPFPLNVSNIENNIKYNIIGKANTLTTLTEIEQEFEDIEPIWIAEGFGSEDERNYYLSLIAKKNKQEESIMELYEKNFDHIDRLIEEYEKTLSIPPEPEKDKEKIPESEKLCMKCGEKFTKSKSKDICQKCLDLMNAPLPKKEEVHFDIQECKVCGSILIGGICNKCKDESNLNENFSIPQI